MKLGTLLLLALCLTLINAIDVNYLRFSGNDLRISDPLYGHIKVDRCRYHQGRKRVYCDFVDKK